MPETFDCTLDWTGAAHGPTRDATTFSREMEVTVPGAVILPMSAAPAYRGDPTRLNPEVLLVASLSACQALTYLFLAARKGVEVVAYRDEAQGRLALVDGRMRVSRVTLRPTIQLAAGADEAVAQELVEKAHEGCFVANSVTTRIEIQPTFVRG